MSKLVAMTKNGETIGVHETLVGNHESAGWTRGGELPVTSAGDKPLEEMSRKELDALAAERGVDISEAKNKGDVIAALELAAEAGE
jgi:hypothetical protein